MHRNIHKKIRGTCTPHTDKDSKGERDPSRTFGVAVGTDGVVWMREKAVEEGFLLLLGELGGFLHWITKKRGI